jgi:hypothetical protein
MIIANYSLKFPVKVDLCTKLVVWSVFLPCVRGLPLRMSELELDQLVARLKSDAECRCYGRQRSLTYPIFYGCCENFFIKQLILRLYSSCYKRRI